MEVTMKVAIVEWNQETGQLEVHADVRSTLRAGAMWLFWHALWLFLGIAIERHTF